MLLSAPKGRPNAALELSEAEDRALRDGFGRYGGGADARAAAAPVVRRHQDAGRWFLCDCRPPRPAVLVPVSGSHIRRHRGPGWSLHAEDCDFFREPRQELAVLATYRRTATDQPLRLAGPFRIRSRRMREPLATCSTHSRRPSLARLLLYLVSEAGLQRLGPADGLIPLRKQFYLIWLAAADVRLDTKIKLRDYLCTNRASLPELERRIHDAPTQGFRHGRPHGVFITRLESIDPGRIKPIAGEAIEVRGRLAVFGEAGDQRRAARWPLRAPYLAACVLGPGNPGGDIQMLSMYAHPCAGPNHLMLLDSARERATLHELRSLQSWLLRKHGLRVRIEKPLFDLGLDSDDDGARPLLIPDFVLRADSGDGQPPRTVIIETMGIDSDRYRERKARVHQLLRQAFAGAPIVRHEFRGRGPQDARDRRFWSQVHWCLSGPSR